jgi:transposase
MCFHPSPTHGVITMRILAIDLGKFKSVACLFDTETNETQYHTLASSAGYLRSFLPVVSADRVVFEACSLAGWVHDLCVELGFEVLVCNPNQEAWKWKNVKRKTDKDDSLKLARLAALGQLVPVHIPGRETRGYRRLVKYRKTLVGRVNRIQNNIRALLVQQGCSAPVGQRAWTAAGLEALSQAPPPAGRVSLARTLARRARSGVDRAGAGLGAAQGGRCTARATGR